MSGDVLSDVLRAVRLRGAVFFSFEAADPWVAETPPAHEIIPAIMPGADVMVEFHCIARGSCWAGIVGEPPMRLEDGDVILFPHGDATSSPARPASGAEGGHRLLLRAAPTPAAVRDEHRRPGGTTAVWTGAASEHHHRVRLPGLRRPAVQPAAGALPRTLRMPGLAAGRETWIGHLLDNAVNESNRRRPGGEAVLERMSEMMFVEVLRRYLDGLPPAQTGLAGRDARPRRGPRPGAAARAARAGVDARNGWARNAAFRAPSCTSASSSSSVCRPCSTLCSGACSWRRDGCEIPTRRSSISHSTWATRARLRFPARSSGSRG